MLCVTSGLVPCSASVTALIQSQILTQPGLSSKPFPGAQPEGSNPASIYSNILVIFFQAFVQEIRKLISSKIKSEGLFSSTRVSPNVSYGNTPKSFPPLQDSLLTLIRMAVKKDVAMRLGVIYESPGDQQKRGRLDVMPRP